MIIIKPGETPLKIFKYLIPMNGESEIWIQAGAKPLSVKLEIDGTLLLWALVDPEAKLALVKFFIFGTGHFIRQVPGGLTYIDTVQGQPYVWHVFHGVIPS